MARKKDRVVNEIDMDEAVVSVGGSKSEFLNVKDDIDYDIRFLPPVGNKPDGTPLKTPWLEHATHGKFVAGKWSGFTVEGSDRKRQLHCLEVHGTGYCPACALKEYSEEEGEDVSWLEPRTKFLMNCVVDDELRVFDAPPSVVAALQDYIKNKKYGVKLFDPAVGRNFTMTRIKKPNGFREYKLVPDPESSRVIFDDWKDRVPELSGFVQLFSEQEMVDILVQNLTGILPVEEAFNKKASKPAPAKGKKTTSAKGKKTSPRKR